MTSPSDYITLVLKFRDKSTEVKEMWHISLFFFIITLLFFQFQEKEEVLAYQCPATDTSKLGDIKQKKKIL